MLIRIVTPEDHGALCEFLAGLCLEARRLRFFSGGVDIDRVAHSVAATGRDRLGLLAVNEEGAIVGHAVAIAVAARRAEVAVEVADELHGEGLGTILIERLAELCENARYRDVRRPGPGDNRAMLDVFREGFDAHIRWS